MRETIQALILDFQERSLETGVPRRLRVTPVPGKATVCIGVRRSGKSTFLYQEVQRLLDRGVLRENICFLNFFDDRLHQLQHESPGVVRDAYYALYPEKQGAETVYWFFDEIQVLPHWEAFVERLMRTENCEVYLTGSSAHMLSREIATQMRGRALSWEVFPFSFREFLDYQGIDASGPLSTKTRMMVEKAFEAYWVSGGFPEVAGVNRDVRIRIHQEYLQAILFRDLVERHDVSHPKALTDLAHRLIDNTASLYTVNKLAGYLKSLGHKLAKPAVSDYLTWFEDAYFLFSVRLFDASLSRANANPKKIYAIDHALVTSVASGVLVNDGHLLENLVFVGLRRTTPDISYYRTDGGREVDFIVQYRQRKRRLIQVCESLSDTATRKREVRALREAMAELGLEAGTIVTRGQQEEIGCEEGTIHVVPAWRFLLTLPELDT